ncbi:MULTISPECIES: diguanylate cyclase [Paenibacillus]|uniref:diguanylate cyclase n=1 Tax=Paenibacillus TaxID=44249 RepID=UPI0022B8D065|nr:diguanylate cyclase [Paenibacillus caseinilyticus]MCZ8523643.1 diguanylate cyclase [Paenibacillus caseinilyticus]
MNEKPAEDRASRELRLMKEGRRRYIDELHKQLRELKAVVTAGEPNNLAEQAKRFYRTVHTLKGSAPMFGFVRVGTVAEKLVEQWEWTQQETLLADPGEVSRRFRESAAAAAPRLVELGLELEIYTQEFELDENQEQLQRKIGLPMGERLLVIDDDEVLRSYLVRRLRLDGYEVDEAPDVITARRLLREHAYQLITLDLMMHPESGYELFELLKNDPTLKYVPLIVLSGRNDVHDKVRCFYLGADDYVTKPFQYEELHARIYSLLKRTRTFEQMAFRDPLTGVYNRRFFDHQIGVELQRIARYPSPISMAFIDIDRFKSVNDLNGHHIGDLVLQGLAYLLQNHLRSTDLLARFGGEEFVIVMPGSTGEDAKRAIEHILELAREGPVTQNEGQAYHITFSAGIAEWTPGLSVEEWIARSDEAMYEAKQDGRNRVVLQSGPSRQEAGDLSSGGAERKRVLIADDDKILRSILLAKLKHLPVDFQEATDGEEAYRAILASPPDLCILDGVMPRLDGYGVLERLQERGERPRGTRVLILSGRSREEDITRALQLGAHAYMHKPFSMVELELKVKELLEIW